MEYTLTNCPIFRGHLKVFSDAHPKVAAFLRDKTAPKAPQQEPHKRVYLDRSSVKTRTVKNHDEFIALLMTYGFETVEIADLNIQEQQELFAQAGVLIGATGSALMSVLFAPAGCHLIELCTEGSFDPTAGPLSHMIGVRHQFLKCQTATLSKSARYKKDFDILVDITALENRLREIGLMPVH